MRGSAELVARLWELPLHATRSEYCHPCFSLAASLTEPAGGCRLLSPCVSVSPPLRRCQLFQVCRRSPWRGFAQGLAAGLTGASATALLAECFSDALASERAAACVTSMLAVGYAVGGLATGACLLTGPTLFPLSYPVTLVVCSIVMVMLLRQPYDAYRRQTELLRLPYLPTGGGWICVVIGAAWSLVGMILSVIPYELSHLGHPGWSGLIAFLMPLAGLAAQPARKRLSPSAAVTLGLVIAPIGCLLLLIGVRYGRLEPILLGAAFSGAAAVGFSFYGGLALITDLSGQEKARGSAAFFSRVTLECAALPSCSAGSRSASQQLRHLPYSASLFAVSRLEYGHGTRFAAGPAMRPQKPPTSDRSSVGLFECLLH